MKERSRLVRRMVGVLLTLAMVGAMVAPAVAARGGSGAKVNTTELRNFYADWDD